MNVRLAVPTAALLLLILIPSLATAQAWISAPGDGYAELSYRQISGDAFYDRDGESTPLASEYTQRTVGVYAQVGVVDRWLQLSLSGEIYRRNELAEQGATDGLGDMRLGAWTGLLQGRHNLAFGLLAGLPTGDDDPGEGLDDPEQRIIASSLPTGDGNFDLTPTLAYGIGFGGGSWPLHHYLSTSVGYLFRFGDLGDSLEWRAELGILAPYPIIRRAWFVVAATGIEPIGEPEQTGFAGLSDGVTYTGLSFGANVRIWRGLGLLARVETALRAANIIKGGPVKIGLYWDF